MRVKCTAIIDNPGERERFLKKLKGLGLKPSVVGNMIYIEYTGYNKTKHDIIVDVFEDRTRHTIETDCK